jgi:hypothetical protein
MPRRSTKILRVCQSCGVEFWAKPTEVRRGGGVFCTRSCYRNRDIPLSDIFNRGLGETTETGCILWGGPRRKNSYGQIAQKIGPSKYRMIRAHRASWILTHGPIPDGQQVCHRCDNPICVNVDHLFLGTFFENMQDKLSKGRQAKGESSPFSRLTEDVVRDIRRSYVPGRVTMKQLADQFGISLANVSHIIHRRTWNHLA